ncbi:flagellar hook-basal body complex protein FliE [Conexibacter sp. SYSU D00693]|uniref:flagellar hook-basal body complex protein FliE n=1 Tax=Conexibacter sp. SYSU D00693 TaxID=2812560 RepID=UPI00196AA2CA|nr:flagellar hook-basal body complex protein FliE [Conexibacter sp. SYSU D00693]
MTVVDPSFLTSGPEWSVDLGEGVGSVGGLGDAERSGAGSFGNVLSEQISNLESLQVDAAEQSRALATGQADDPAQVVMAVEKARLSMQLAAQLRTKGVEAINDVMHTQV